jgi:hypothetical protein
MTTIERSAPASPSSTLRASAALSCGSPAPIAAAGAASTPSSSGVIVRVSMRPSLSSTARVGPDTPISSNPSSLDTTSALSAPSCPSAAAIVSM